MGLGSKEPQQRIYFMSAKVQDKDKQINPHFNTRLRVDGSTTNLPDENSVSGFLVKIGTEQYYWPKDSRDPNDLVTNIVLVLVDGEDKFKVTFGANSSYGRAVINTVAGTRDFNVMKIRLYVKNEQANIFIANDDQKTSWKFDYNEVLKPLIYEVENPVKRGQKMKVYHDVDDMLMKEWLAMVPYIDERARANGWVQAAPSGAKDEASDTNSLQSEFDRSPEPSQVGDEPYRVENNSVSDDLPF